MSLRNIVMSKFFLLGITILLSLICIGEGYYIYYLSIKEPVIEECDTTLSLANDNEAIIEEEKEEKIYVDVKGAIKKPGVYEMSEDAIINDLVKLAGGFKSNAYTKNVNLSKKLSDEMVLYIYTKSEFKGLGNDNNTITECNCPNYDISSCITEGSSVITSDEYASNNSEISSTNTTLININSASVSELLNLSGIGEAKAQAIIEYRNTNGNFNSIEDLKKVNGIGESVFEKIKNNITV